MVDCTWSLPECQGIASEDPVYFDATPEGSVIFDWDVTADPSNCGVDLDAAASMPFCMPDTYLAGTSQQQAAEDAEKDGPCNRKSRPPKLVREVRDLQENIRHLSHDVREKVGMNMLEVALGHKVNREDFQEALDEKVSQDHFQQLRLRVKGKLDTSFGDMLRDTLEEKANQAELQQLRFNVDGKADRASVQAALARKVNWDCMTWRLTFCGAVWASTALVCALALVCFFNILLQQQEALQRLSLLNEELSDTIQRLDKDNHRLNDTLQSLGSVERIVARLDAPKTLSSRLIDALGNGNDAEGTSLEVDAHGRVTAHSEVFTSRTVDEDTYTIELVPPFNNAWLIVDASLGAAGIVCSGKADAILRSEHKIFSFYAPPDTSSEKIKGIEDSDDSIAQVELNDKESDGDLFTSKHAVLAATTTTTTTPAPCMIMSTSLKEQQGGSIIVIINFKRDPQSFDGNNGSSLFNVSGRIQWFQQ